MPKSTYIATPFFKKTARNDTTPKSLQKQNPKIPSPSQIFFICHTELSQESEVSINLKCRFTPLKCGFFAFLQKAQNDKFPQSSYKTQNQIPPQNKTHPQIPSQAHHKKISGLPRRFSKKTARNDTPKTPKKQNPQISPKKQNSTQNPHKKPKNPKFRPPKPQKT